jgi:diguanylate cyclase (GGDEF)-like protein
MTGGAPGRAAAGEKRWRREAGRMSHREPDDEPRRIAALRELEILDTDGSPAFDAVARLAADLFGVPIGLVTLVDSHRLWFKAHPGLAAATVPRRFSFCRQTILGREALIIPDAAADPTWRDNPFVAAGPRLRFYAGVPLALDGVHNVGTLCVLGRHPLRPTEDQVRRLADLGALAEALLAGHQAARQVARAAEEADERRREAASHALYLKQIETIASIGAWRLDLHTEGLTGSSGFYAIYDLEESTRFDLERNLACLPAEGRQIAERKIAEALIGEKTFDFDFDVVTARGRRKRVRTMGEVEMENGAPRRLVGVARDVSAEHEAMQRLWRAVNVDGLTGLANRSRFLDRLAEAIVAAGKAERGLGLLILDLDAFKEVNDSLGHRAGDEVIRTVAERFAAAAGEETFVARLGSDEFAAVIDSDDEASLTGVAGEIAAQVRRPIPVDGSRLFLSGSIGIARYPADAATADDLHRCADVALYQVKKTGRGTTGFFTRELGELFDQRRAAVELVRHAGTEGRIAPYYQPMVRLEDRAPIGFEALARIEGPNGVCGPSVFWRAFDDPESARQIDDQMFALATADVARWRAIGLPAGRISVNVSEYYFKTAGFAERVLHRLARLDIPPSALKLEVTETILLGEDTGHVGAILGHLHDAGVAIALDDFGTGYASLTHLRDFPIDVIKIDRSFLRDVHRRPASAVIVRAMIELAANLDIEVVAEGVETEDQAGFLTEAGCTAAQGYLFGAAMSAAQVERDILSAGLTRVTLAEIAGAA